MHIFLPTGAYSSRLFSRERSYRIVTSHIFTSSVSCVLRFFIDPVNPEDKREKDTRDYKGPAIFREIASVFQNLVGKLRRRSRFRSYPRHIFYRSGFSPHVFCFVFRHCRDFIVRNTALYRFLKLDNIHDKYFKEKYLEKKIYFEGKLGPL